MLRFLDCVGLLAPAGRQVENCVKHLPRENRVTRVLKRLTQSLWRLLLCYLQ